MAEQRQTNRLPHLHRAKWRPNVGPNEKAAITREVVTREVVHQRSEENIVTLPASQGVALFFFSDLQIPEEKTLIPVGVGFSGSSRRSSWPRGPAPVAEPLFSFFASQDAA
jgi:hypothetical protein